MNSRVYLAALTLLGPVAPLYAHAEVFMTAEQAAAAIFPGEKMVKSTLRLSDGEIQKIQDQSRQDVRNATLTVFQDGKKNSVYIDQVLGKHEFITIAVGIDADGTVKGVEILEYRESYGKEVRGAAWLKQFDGKDVHSPLTLTKDIKNISGATLSSLHVTNGVRRLVVTHDVTRHAGS